MKIDKLTEEQYAHLDGYIYISSEKRKDESGNDYISNDFFYTELCRTSRPLYLENDTDMPYFQILHLGGGFKANEVFQSDLVVCDNSKAIYTSQAATKVYKDADNEGPSRYYVNLSIGNNAYCEYINDSVILYKDARFIQENKFYLTNSSSLYYSEIFSPGYSPDQTKYRYHLMHLNTCLYMDDKLLVYDNLVFEPSICDPSQFGIMDNIDRCGTCYLFNPNINETHLDDIRKLVKENFTDFPYQIGTSTFDKNGIGIRILANETFQIEKIFSAINTYFRKTFFNMGPLNLRKQ